MEWDILSNLKRIAALLSLLSLTTLGLHAQSITGDRVVLNPQPCTLRPSNGTPTGGTNCDVAIRYDAANEGIWQRIGGTWLKLAHSQDAADLPTVAARTDVSNTFLFKQIINVNGETLEMFPTTGTNGSWLRTHNTGDALLLGMESSVGGVVFPGSTAYDGLLGVQGAHGLSFATNNTARMRIDANGHLTPYVTSAYDLGSPTLWWRNGYLSTMNATLFAKSTQTLYGGWLSVSKNAGTFAVAVASGNTTIDFGTAMTLNQFVVVRAADTGGTITEEYIKVGTLSSGTVYNVTRNLSGAGAKNWAKGTPFQVRGVSGDGWLELNAFDTPRFSVWTQGSAYNNSTENLRIGHLTGMPNSSSGIGMYIGDATNYLRYDSTALTLKSATVSIDGTKIAVAPNSVDVYSSANAYGFVAANGVMGTAGNDVAGILRTVDVTSTFTSGTGNTSVRLKADGNAGSSTTFNVTSDGSGNSSITASTGIADYGRATPLGDWADVATGVGANFTSDTGSTWTVTAGSQITYAYALWGHTMNVQFQLDSTNVTSNLGSAAPAELWLKIPGSKVCARKQSQTVEVINAGGASAVGKVYCNATDTVLRFQSTIGGGTWSHTAGNNTFVRGQINISIQ